MAQFLSGEEMLKAAELAKSPYRPKEILNLKEEIEAKTRLAEFRATITGAIDQNLIDEIVAMKICLDGLYCDWVQGRIS